MKVNNAVSNLVTQKTQVNPTTKSTKQAASEAVTSESLTTSLKSSYEQCSKMVKVAVKHGMLRFEDAANS